MTTAAGIAQPRLIKRTCPKCGYIRETTDTKCPDCGKTLVSVMRIRVLGVFLVMLGTCLLVFMSALSYWIYGLINEPTKPGSTPRFTGGPQEIRFIIFVFALVILIALVSVLGGLWQIIFGKRNKLLVIVIIVLGAVLVVTGRVISLAK